MGKLIISLLLCVLLSVVSFTGATHHHHHHKNKQNRYHGGAAVSTNRQREVLEGNGRVVLEWEVDFQQKKIVFDLTAETTGFVGFGLSPVGGMAGSDIVVGGIHPNGTSYFSVSRSYSRAVVIFKKKFMLRTWL